ncbi:MAG: carbohydrate porin [Xanthomonadales bacterium]|nr:carbohydrate porin [Xanthomonadales bacterium]
MTVIGNKCKAGYICLLVSLSLFLATTAVVADSEEVRWELVYTADTWNLLSGGVDPGSTYLDNLDFTVDIDAESLWGLQGVQFFVYGLYNNGREFSSTRVGDHQVISNIETGERAARLYEAWINFDISPRTDIRFGLYDLNSEFDALESAQLFLGSAHGIGTEISQTGENGPSIFPVTSLALRWQHRFHTHWTARAAVLDGVPGDPERPTRTAVRLGGDDGALLIGELQRESPGFRALLGTWAYSRRIDVGDSKELRNHGAYVRGEWLSLGAKSNYSIFARYGFARREANLFSHFLSGGVNWRAFSAKYPEDEAGIAFSWAHGFDEVAERPANNETVIELTYRRQFSDRFAMQPNLQYVINPGLDRAIDNALAVGIRFEIRIL